MREINRDNLPHLIYCLNRIIYRQWYIIWANCKARWWGIQLNKNCIFNGIPKFKRHPESKIFIGQHCTFNSAPTSNWIGVNRPCLISTLKTNANLTIKSGCGFSGTVVACAGQITLGKNVRCGANTLITDTDWHNDDPRTKPDMPVSINDNVWLGVNVTVLKGVSIGEGTLVSAGSIVTKSLPPYVLAGGIPAKVIKPLPPT